MYEETVADSRVGDRNYPGAKYLERRCRLPASYYVEFPNGRMHLCTTNSKPFANKRVALRGTERPMPWEA